jgi:hypothetical protein
MTPRADDDVASLVADLVATLQELEAEFEPRTERGFPRPPSPGELVRFTSDVAVPAAILVLRSNIEALKLLQRALRLADGREPTTSDSRVRDRAEALSDRTLASLDNALGELQEAVDGTPPDSDARDLVAQAQQLREEIETAMATDEPEAATPANEAAETDTPVAVDVDAELESIKQSVDGEDESPSDVESASGDDGPDSAGKPTDSDGTNGADGEG